MELLKETTLKYRFEFRNTTTGRSCCRSNDIKLLCASCRAKADLDARIDTIHRAVAALAERPTDDADAAWFDHLTAWRKTLRDELMVPPPRSQDRAVMEMQQNLRQSIALIDRGLGVLTHGAVDLMPLRVGQLMHEAGVDAMLTRRQRAIRGCGLLVLATCSLGTARCPSSKQPTLICTDFSVHLLVPTGEAPSCVAFPNPCRIGGEWLGPRRDGFELDEEQRPASVWESPETADGVTTHALCVRRNSPTVVDRRIVFTYQLGDEFGNGHLDLTVSDPLEVVVTATPTTIDIGDGSQLVAAVFGGLVPYSFNWIPTSGLNSTNIPTPQASQSVTTTYEVTVTDAAGTIRGASVTVHVNFELIVTADPPHSINFGDVSQLNATGFGGNLPITYIWMPADTLSDATISNPLASPQTTTTYISASTDVHPAAHWDA